MWATVLRVALRFVVAELWITAALNSPWLGLAVVFWILAALTLAFSSLAIANRVKNHGVVLRLMGTGTIEWPPSYQEQWLRREMDWVDGARIEVLLDEPILFPTPSAPHVSLRGDTHGIARVPLYRSSVEAFMVAVNAAMEGRGVELVENGRATKPPRSSRKR